MSSHGLHRQPSQPTRWLAWLCLAVLLAAQGLGQIHRLAHASAAADAAWTASHDDHDWGHHQGSLDCQVLDHLGQADGVASPPLHAGHAPQQACPAAPLARSASLSARWSRGAREPPSSLRG
jgi:hypothetical protein